MYDFDSKLPALVAGVLLMAAAFGQSKNSGCIACHGQTDSPTMHTTGTVYIGCTDCHGGDGEARVKNRAHPQPGIPELWRSSGNPVRPFTDWLKENKEYIRFVNPGDLRVAVQTCGTCHPKETGAVQ